MIAFIPARAGSKGLPGKNIRLLNGKPLIAYSIEAALKSQAVSRVIVSTDCEEIANIAVGFGAEIPFIRPHHLSSDSAKSIDVFKYTVDRLEREEQITIPNFMVLQPTSPLRKAIHIDEAARLFIDSNADSVISFCREDHPIFWHKYIDDAGKLEDIFKGEFLRNRQEIKTTYYPNGAIYILSKNMLYADSYYTEASRGYIMDRIYSVDIDYLEDFQFAEWLIKNEQ